MAIDDEIEAGDEGMPGPEGNPAQGQPEEVQTAHAVQLRKDVGAEVKRREEGGEVRNRIVQELADAEMKNRVDKLTKAFAKRDQMERDLNKIRPDAVTYKEDGSKATESYSKDQLEKRKKAKEDLAKLDKAIGKVLDKSDYGDLQKFIGS